MITRISRWFDRQATGRLILALVVLFAAFELVTLPILQSSAAGKIEPLDAQFFYTPKDAFSTIGAYADARSFWIGVYLTWDIVNPVLYTTIFCLIISWTFRRGFKAEDRIQRLNVLPVGAGLFDLIENASIVTLLASYPSRMTLIAWLGTACTMAKVVILGLSALLILLGTSKAAINRFVLQ